MPAFPLCPESPWQWELPPVASAPAARAERLAGSLRAACQSLEDSQHPWGKGLFWELLFKGVMAGLCSPVAVALSFL